MQLSGGGVTIVRLLLAILALLAASGARAEPAQAPLEPLGTFKHVSWPLEAGAPGRINDITQARDGYLWIGSVDGLFRFDGVTFERIDFDKDRSERTVVSEVLGARSGLVWVGLARSGGVAVYRGGRLIDASMPHPSREITSIAEDSGGGVWVARGGRRRDTLARFFNGRWEEIGAKSGLPEGEVWQLLFTRGGDLWVVLNDTIVRRDPGTGRFELTGIKTTRRASLAEDGRGRLWLSDTQGTRLLRADSGASRAIAQLNESYHHTDPIGGTRILFDRRGDLWGATWTDGIFHIGAPGSTGATETPQAFRAANGLTSDQTHAIYQDREGDIWIGTELGLDMLRPAAVVADPEIPPNSPATYRMTGADGGMVYVADAHTLYAIAPGKAAKAVLHTEWSPGSLCAARGGGVWVTLRDTVLRVRGSYAETFPKPAAASAYGCAEDKAGRLWMAALDQGLYVRENGAWRTWPGFSSTVGVPGNVALMSDGRAAVFLRNPFKAPVTPPVELVDRDRAKVGGLEGLLPGRDRLYISGSRGMAEFRGGHISRLDAAQHPWLTSVNGLVQTPGGETWTFGDAGILRMRSADLAAAFAQPGRALPYTLFDFRDGLNSFVQKAPGTQVAAGGDGRIWILTRRNVVRIDPATLQTNTTPPPVAIRAIKVGDTVYRDPVAVKLRPGVTALSIDYAALSLPAPSRVAFRYKLDGVDRDWIEAGSRRQALYGSLRPGTHRFHVIAANNDGVWNRDGATMTFVIPPTLTQTWGFRAACVAAFALGLWLLYALRLRQVSGQLRKRLEERTAERERIARELHDTLLQSVQGLTMRFQSVADHIAEDHPAKTAIDRALDRADQVLVEGRDRVRDLRRPRHASLEVVLKDLAAEQPFARDTAVTVTVSGTPREVDLVVLDEVVRIVGEALFNTAKHADANKVKATVSYGRRLEVAVEDDGVGIGSQRLATAGSDGHYGLVGMQERARKLGGQFSLESRPGSGTLITLSISGSVAYAPDGVRRRFRAWLTRNT